MAVRCDGDKFLAVMWCEVIWLLLPHAHGYTYLLEQLGNLCIFPLFVYYTRAQLGTILTLIKLLACLYQPDPWAAIICS